jgi:Fur family transcriptional regulator, ferric uptake regulator
LSTQHSIDRTLQILQESGYRITSPRRTVIDVAQQIDGLFTADELVKAVADANPEVGRATVFRTLDVLVQNAILDRIHRPDGCHSYVVSHASNRHHHHLICSDCGTVVHFEDCTIGPLLAELSRRTKFEISDHWLEVFGRCAACKR